MKSISINRNTLSLLASTRAPPVTRDKIVRRCRRSRTRGTAARRAFQACATLSRMPVDAESRREITCGCDEPSTIRGSGEPSTAIERRHRPHETCGWNSALLGPAFLVSASRRQRRTRILSRVTRGARAAGQERQRVPVDREVFIGFLDRADQRSEPIFLRPAWYLAAPYAGFWVVVVGFGIVVPLVIQTLPSRTGSGTSGRRRCLLAGGIALRFVMVLAASTAVATAT